MLAYRGVVAKRLRVLTKREHAATAREGLRRLLARGRIVLRPNLARAQFEGTAAFDAIHFSMDNQIDIKMVAAGGFDLYITHALALPIVPASLRWITPV
ncbi:MAG: hypothetical protein WA446_06530 [Steroidobacteraceae bacterium]